MRELIPAVGLVLAGAVVVWQQPATTAEPEPPAPAQAETPVVAAPAPAATQARSRPASVPTRVRIPSLGVDAAVDPVSPHGTELDPPADPARVGWWAQGSRSGARHGATLLTGHTVRSGGGAFDHLEDLAPGDRVTVDGLRGASSYVVETVETMPRAELAERSGELFGQQGPHRLVMVTCEDWDGAAWRSSVVVVARPAR